MNSTGQLYFSDGHMSWSAAAPALLPFTFSTGTGVTIGGDAFTPRRAISWMLGAIDSPGELISAFDDVNWQADFREALADPTASTVMHAPAGMSRRMARLAVVEAIGALMPYPVDDAVIEVDRAVAVDALGDRERASDLFHLASDALGELAEGRVAAGIGGAFTQEVLTACRAAIRLLESPHLTSLVAELEACASRAESSRLPAWASAEDHEDRAPTEPTSLVTGFVDPLLVPVRALAWHGANQPELMAAHPAGDRSLHISVATSEAVDDATWLDLRAFALRQRDGALWASATLQPAQGTLQADLPLRGMTVDQLVFGVVDLDRVDRLDAERGRQVLPDRLALDAWALSRLASASALVGEEASQRARSWNGMTAAAHAESCRDALRSLAADATEQAESFTAKARIADRFVASLADPTRIADPVVRPTLAEFALSVDRSRDR